MHAIEGSGNVPAFLTKLWRLVDDVKTNDLISWTQNGRSFIIKNQAKFAQDLLPQYYKHNNMASFVRQLNMYGFHKVVSADSGGLRVERDEMEFAHNHFQRGQEALIENIKRKQQRRLASDGIDFSQIPTSRTMILEDNKSVTKLLNDVRDMKRDQDSMSTKLLGLKRENEALWREYASMRQKFSKQQQIIEKLIHFLIAMVKNPSKTLVPKRKFNHLALEGGEETTTSSGKINSLPQFSQGTSIDIVGDCEGGTNGGAQIHEVTDLVDPDDPESITNVFMNENSSLENGTFYDAATKSSEGSRNINSHVAESSRDRFEPGTILNISGEPLSFIDIAQEEVDGTVTVREPITASSVVSPGGTVVTDNTQSKFSSLLLEEAPLSPELLNTVDPSVVTQSFKYPVSETPVMNTSSVKAAAGTSSFPAPSTSTKGQVHTVPQKGKTKTSKSQKNASKASTMSVVVPEKSIHNVTGSTISHDHEKSWSKLCSLRDAAIHGKRIRGTGQDSRGLVAIGEETANNGQELQAHMDDVQNSIDSLQDLLTLGNFNVDPSMLLSMFGSEESYLPELDSVATVTSGNELSVYNPSLLDLAGDMEDDDPLPFLSSSMASTSSAATLVPSSSSSPSTAHSNSSVGPSPPKQLKLSIKREKEDTDDVLETPKILSPVHSPLYRGKRRTN
ncbi:uncharacterized protein Hsf isoform X2 [Panulirus ornatus]|uniref:uncharacterized protein Hsf isoform X2 n=1 Tax=Panulirus ornatus TaxID=150431 RepID=UPI003A89C914